jgi:hypothetical protein
MPKASALRKCSFQLPEDLVSRAKELVKKPGTLAAEGMRLTFTDVVRMALAAGLGELEERRKEVERGAR